jgi:tetratricopeptide (TPR) repeat protein
VNTRIVLAAGLLGMGAYPAAAQQPAVNDRVVHGLPSRYLPPTCGLKAGHFKVSSGATYLKTGVETEVPANKTRVLASGQKILLEAIQQNGQDKNPAAWYYLGRIYLQQGDLAGADTAFTKAEALSPACKQDISAQRYNGWVPLVNAGINFAKEQKNDSALALFREANTIYRDKPQAYSAAAVILANNKMDDSAIVYLQKAADIATAANMAEDRNQATFNLAAVLQRQNRNEEAAAALERYLGWVPNDVEAKRALAGIYRATGKLDKAKALEAQAGVGPAAAAAPAAGTGQGAAMNAAIALYNAKKYDSAATAFEQVVAAEPYNRDALYGLANSYIGLKKGAQLAQTATRLVAIEPLNDDVLRMLATGQRMAKKEALANKTAMQVIAMPVSIAVKEFAPAADGASVKATATGRDAQNSRGKPIVPKPITVIFEFLDSKGTVVGNQEIQVPALKTGETHPIEAKAQGTGISAWRYKTPQAKS